jgi:hypothetical protein
MARIKSSESKIALPGRRKERKRGGIDDIGLVAMHVMACPFNSDCLYAGSQRPKPLCDDAFKRRAFGAVEKLNRDPRSRISPCCSVGVSLSYPNQIPDELPIPPTRMGLFGRSDCEAIAFQCEKAKQLSWKCWVPCEINCCDKAARPV